MKNGSTGRQRRANALRLALWLVVGIWSAGSLAEEVRVVGNRLFVPVTVNGVESEALLDSGAEMTLLDVAMAERLGLSLAGSETARGTGGTQEVRFAQGLELESTGMRLTGLTVAVLDLSDVARRLVGEPVHLVLGRELFDAGRFALDIEAGGFRAVGDTHQPSGVRVELRDHAGIKQLPVTIEGVPAFADFDLGNGSRMLIGRPFALRQGWLSPSRSRGTEAGGGLGGGVDRELIHLESVTIAGRRFDGITAAVDPLSNAAEANVGVALLRQFRLTIDFPGNQLWLEPIADDHPAAEPR